MSSRERTARTRSVIRIADLRPNLFHKVAKNFFAVTMFSTKQELRSGPQIAEFNCSVLPKLSDKPTSIHR